jgi:hypothetical protein
MLLHLVQMRAAGESGEVAEEDEEQGRGVEIREMNGGPIQALKAPIGHRFVHTK